MEPHHCQQCGGPIVGLEVATGSGWEHSAASDCEAARALLARLGQVLVDRQKLMPEGRALHARFHDMTKAEWDAENESLADRFSALRDAEMALLEQIMGRPPMYGGFEIPVKCKSCGVIQPIGRPIHRQKNPCDKCVSAQNYDANGSPT